MEQMPEHDTYEITVHNEQKSMEFYWFVWFMNRPPRSYPVQNEYICFDEIHFYSNRIIKFKF